MLKYSQEEVNALFKKINVSRWDTYPPKSGKISFFNSENEKVAEGDYKVILSYGPSNMFTMAWSISIYASMGIPFVEKKGDEQAVQENATMDDAWNKAMEVGNSIDADFVYSASTLMLAVFNFKVIGEQEEIA